MFLLFALYFENLERLREGAEVDAEGYESGVTMLGRLAEECLYAIENHDLVELHASVDSFARTALRLKLP